MNIYKGNIKSVTVDQFEVSIKVSGLFPNFTSIIATVGYRFKASL